MCFLEKKKRKNVEAQPKFKKFTPPPSCKHVRYRERDRKIERRDNLDLCDIRWNNHEVPDADNDPVTHWHITVYLQHGVCACVYVCLQMRIGKVFLSMNAAKDS